MDFPIVLKKVLSEDKFFNFYDHIFEDWTLGNRSKQVKTGEDKISWGKLFHQENDLIYYDIATIIKLKIKKYLKRDLILIGCHVNGQTSGQTSLFHTDYSVDNVWTFVLFTNPTWNTNYGGELVVYHPLTCKYHYVPYIPNNGALFPSNWSHVGTSPNFLTDQLRTSVAFRYRDFSVTSIH